MTFDLNNQSAISNKKIAFIGAGNMSAAIIEGLIHSGLKRDQIKASNPSPGKLDALQEKFGIGTTQDNANAAAWGDIVVLAVKPQKLYGVCEHLAETLNQKLKNKLFISVAAGFPTERIIQALGQTVSIVRAMPNTPGLVQMGATGIFANSETSAKQLAMAKAIFCAIGITALIDDESLMDTVTAIAGSSPAYFFLMFQAMLEQAIDSGLTEDAAFNMITQTASGAAKLAIVNRNKSLQQLRAEVTSPGGTTAAAIESFQNNQFEDIIKQAIRAAIARGQELGKLN